MNLDEIFPAFEAWAKKKYQFIHWSHDPLDVIKMWEAFWATFESEREQALKKDKLTTRSRKGKEWTPAL